MKKLVLLILLVFGCKIAFAQDTFNSFEQAKLHPLAYDRPAPDFFEGALLGNGAMGVVVTTRPDAVVFYFGHNNVWDIRIAENNKDKIGTFNEVFNRVKAIPDTLELLTDNPWYKEYSKMTAENYGKPYPRPFPCGSVLLGFDRRNAELIGHRLDVSNGLCEVYLLTRDQKKITLQVFTDMTSDQLWFRLVDSKGNSCANVFDRIKVMSDPSTPIEFPKTQIEENLEKGVIAFRQTLPYAEPEKYDAVNGHPKDKAFRLITAVNCALEKKSRINWDGNQQKMSPMEAGIVKQNGFVGCISIREGLNSSVEKDLPAVATPRREDLLASLDKGQQIWKEYWNKSGVKLGDQFLERMWYQNLYFLNCATKDGATTPGLFANWSYNNIGTAWHGDYHMNYNTQQPFWVTFSSNHLEKNLPYVNLIEKLVPVSKSWAKNYYELPGAYFPHSAYPVDMTINAYPVPTWGWEIAETPWAVQGLWWHYLYSGDVEFLKNRAFEPMKLAVEFLVAYMKRPEAIGPQWKDDKFHIFPTVPPELYGLRPGFKYNYDCNVDLALTKFVFNAFIEATKVLKIEKSEQVLLDNVKMILSHFPDYPTAISKEYGKVLVSVPEEHDQVVYNVPNSLFSVFPGEDHGLHSDSETMKLLKNTFYNQQNEGGNDLVFINLQAARIGMLDLERFKRHVNYSLLPNGTTSDRVMQVHGRYSDTTPYGYMDKMGIWVENFALPVVVNECLMQSYDGTIRLFPNWPREKDAEFHDLRAAGAFLVSASLKNGKVNEIKVTSEAGGVLKMILPWKTGGKLIVGKHQKILTSNLLELQTEKGEIILFNPQ
ncbi:MAG: glycoside hydrolase N-terminal domain-containing protein [Bacteroidota bacterium]|nr:glycoside hydrolase N-terminal domain-containing protein [Bacteroidota bacterium]MDP4273133.1 glycoside hydrolase N-terminal domain-containing protein [Bacteroidota bacterium]